MGELESHIYIVAETQTNITQLPKILTNTYLS